MDIKLKNRGLNILLLIIIIYILSVSILTAIDIRNHSHFFTVDISRLPKVDVEYYNSIKERVIKEIALLISALGIGAGLIFIGIKQYKIHELLEKPLSIYIKIPIDIRAFGFLIYTFFMLGITRGLRFFYLPIGIDHVIKLTFVSIYVFYLVINLWEAFKFITVSDYLIEQLKKSFIYTSGIMLRDSFAVKSVGVKVLTIVWLTAFTGLFFALFFIGWRSNDFLFLVSGLYMILYLIFVPRYVIKHVSHLNRIIIGAEEIALGNLNHVIDENGKSSLSKLANSINNMGSSYKKSVEDQLKSERLKTELITNVSHDLKTPLTSIINYIDILKKEEIPEEVKDYVGIIDRKAQRLKALIDDLFEASKMTSGAIELDLEKLDVVSLLKQSLGEYDEKIKSSTLEFKVNTPEKSIYAELDGKKTWRVFENLISNILKYSMPNTRVYIDISEDENYATVTMKNISNHELDFNSEELFERFIRGDKSRNTEGSGLGLAIAKSIVELQGGRLDIEIDGDLFKAIVYFNKMNLG